MIELSTSDGIKITAKGINISESGMLCQTDRDIPTGTFVMFNLLINSGESPMNVSLEGMVIKSEKEGVKFNVVVDFTS